MSWVSLLFKYACVHAKSLQSYPTLWDPMNCSPSGSSVHGISRQEYWRRLPCPPPGNLPDPGIKSTSLVYLASAGGFFTTGTTKEAMCAKLQPTCDPMDCSQPGSSVHGIFQARILECVAISFSRGSSRPRDWTRVPYISCIGRQVLYH